MNKFFRLDSLLFMLVTCLFVFGAGRSMAAGADCPLKRGSVSRAMFTTRVDNREPVDQVLILEDKYKQVFFFTELRNLEGHEVIHRWEHNGKIVTQKEFNVRGPRWRVFSSLRLNDRMLGRWTAIVTTKDGCPLKAAVFQYVATNPKGPGSAILELKK